MRARLNTRHSRAGYDAGDELREREARAGDSSVRSRPSTPPRREDSIRQRARPEPVGRRLPLPERTPGPVRRTSTGLEAGGPPRSFSDLWIATMSAEGSRSQCARAALAHIDPELRSRAAGRAAPIASIRAAAPALAPGGARNATDVAFRLHLRRYPDSPVRRVGAPAHRSRFAHQEESRARRRITVASASSLCEIVKTKESGESTTRGQARCRIRADVEDRGQARVSARPHASQPVRRPRSAPATQP